MAISKDAQAVLAGVDQATKDYILSQSYGSNLTSGEAQRFLDAYKAANPVKPLENVPDFLKNDPAFQNLPRDMQEIAVYNYNVQKTNDTQKAQALATALEQATAQADPYWKNIIRIAQDEVLRGVEEAQGDYTSQNQRLLTRIDEINQDLANNRQYLTLDQQASLASLSADLTDRQQTFARNMEYLGAQKASQLQSAEIDYNKSIDDINRNIDFTAEEKAQALKDLNRNFIIKKEQLTQGAADAGLTFSTKRKIAEQRLGEEQQGLVESTNRQFNKQQADLLSNKAYAQSQYGLQTGNINTQFQFQTEEQRQAQATAERGINEARAKLQLDYQKRIAELETEAARGNTAAQFELTDLQRKLQESITSMGRTAEKFLGTENLPAMQGYTPLTGVTGDVYEQNVKDVELRKQGLYNDLTQASLNYATP